MSSNGTSTSSFEHQRCTSIGAPSFSWSWRKCRSRSRTAVTIATGTLTSPKLSDPLQSERGIDQLLAFGRVFERFGFLPRLASSAAIRSSGASSSSNSGSSISSPLALSLISSATRSR